LYLFQVFQNTESLDKNDIEEIQKEWTFSKLGVNLSVD